MVRGFCFFLLLVLTTPVVHGQWVETHAQSRFMIDDLVLDPRTGDLYGTNRSHRVTRVTTAGTEEAFALGFQYVTGVAITAQGNVYATDTVAGTLTKIDTEGTRTVFASGFLNPVGIIAHPTEEILYTVTTSEPGELFEIQGDGTVRRVATNLPRGANDLVRTENGTFYTAHFGNEGRFLYRIDPDGSVHHFFDMPLERSIGFGYIAYHDGYIYYSDMMAHAVHRVNLAGQTERVAGTTGGFADGPAETAQLWAPVGIALSPTGDTLYVSSFDRDQIRRITGLTTASTSTGTSPLPITASLEANYPNPFRESTRLRYALAQPSPARVTVFDALGRKRAAWSFAVQSAGTYDISVNTAGWAPGVYYYRLQTDTFAQTRPMLLVR